jgi:DNA-binding IscR family transcriptional regulator
MMAVLPIAASPLPRTSPTTRRVDAEARVTGRLATPPEQCREACGLAARMAEAEAAWRQSLRAVTIADIAASLPDGAQERTRALLARPR